MAIIIAHGGVIGAANRHGGGAQFFFLLPVDEAPPELAAEQPQDE
jgi:two-component system sensor histidine kinase KdpD